MDETGFAGFSAREVARRVGYSVGTIYNVFASLDELLLAINTRTFSLWTAYLDQRLARQHTDRIGVLVEAYFDFAREHRKLWMAIYDHRLPAGMALPERDASTRRELMALVEAEVAAELPARAEDEIRNLARSLVACVHGHCAFALGGQFVLMGEQDPVGQALQRVREAIDAAR